MDRSERNLTPVPAGQMLGYLHEALKRLPELLRTADGWKSMLIQGYYPPVIRRMYRRDVDTVGRYWLSLHEFDPCEDEGLFLHPHEWPTASHTVSGLSIVSFGFSEAEMDGNRMPDDTPPVCARVVNGPGSEYEMIHPHVWHSVHPVKLLRTVFVTGRPWARSAPKGPAPELSKDDFERMFTAFQAHFGSAPPVLGDFMMHDGPPRSQR